MPRDSDTPMISSNKPKKPIYRHRSMGLFNLLKIKTLCSFSIIHNNECRTLLYGNHCFCETFSDYKTLCRLCNSTTQFVTV